ncbi:MAG: NAD(P)(+) transhydrogenase (Re/Si-specific) subunit beta, partial [Phycisphaerae bacterium]
GMKGLTHPRTAVRGNLTSAVAMLMAVVATLVFTDIISWVWIVIGLVVGSIIGTVMALKVPMTGMPQMVAVFNGFGGGASFLVAGAELMIRAVPPETTGDAAHAGLGTQFTIATAAAGLIGAVTLLGSLVAYAKLAEFSITLKPKIEGDKPRKIWLSNSLLIPGRHAINVVLALACLLLFISTVTSDSPQFSYWALVLLASVLGVLITIPIGGADMPVVIALLNSYSGLAACATGFVIDNNVLIIAGSLVGASGLILTAIMCKAMNRSLANVMFATLGGGADGPSADDVYAGKIKSTSAEEIAMLFDTAQRVAIVPGYGMAVSQAQHAVRDLANLLESKGITVEFGIHPVAGRMPGHMNVLLAEANIEYDKLLEMDVINPTLSTVDVALVVGANDVVNPVAREEGSAIAGMPIIDVDKCRTVVVIKRSLSPGFAGIPNPLFAADNCLMFFNDGKKAFNELIQAVKES